jgi:hypothetical protein
LEDHVRYHTVDPETAPREQAEAAKRFIDPLCSHLR